MKKARPTNPPAVSRERTLYLRRKRRRTHLVHACQIGFLVFFFAQWEISARLGWIDSFILSQPSRILETLRNMSQNHLMMHVGVTLYETLTGFVLGVLLGIIAAIHRNKFADNLIMVLSLLTVSTPSFFLALILMLIFCLNLRWLPSIGMDTWQGAILPIATLGLQAIGSIARTTRSAMLDVIHQDYIRTSRSRGVPERVITYRHAFKNALIPVLTTIGLRFGGLLAGATLVETVFSIPGIGRFVVDSVSNRDYPAIQGAVLVLAVTFVLVNTLVDLLYAAVDPRVKYD